MSTTSHVLTVSDIPVSITRKDIKRLHLSVYPPEGQVKVSAPLYMTDDNIRLAVVSRLKWIRTQQKKFQGQERQTQRDCISGESHYVWGKRYLLDVQHQSGKHAVTLSRDTLIMRVSVNITRPNRERLLADFYRSELNSEIPALLEKWATEFNQSSVGWGVKRMKTKWGSCNPQARRIWLNLELAKKPIECLEYVLVHELAHLIEPNHSYRFTGLLDEALPNWRLANRALNNSPLAHEKW